MEDRLQRERGDLVPLPQLLVLLDRIIGSFKNQMLGLGSNLAPKLEGQDTANRRKTIDRAIRERLTELARSKPSTMDLRRLGSLVTADSPDGDTTTGDVAVAVGRREKGAKSREQSR
jgi:hypothetical protein